MGLYISCIKVVIETENTEEWYQKTKKIREAFEKYWQEFRYYEDLEDDREYKEKYKKQYWETFLAGAEYQDYLEVKV